MIISEEDDKKLQEYIKWLNKKELKKNGMIGSKVHSNKNKYNGNNKRKQIWLSQD